MAPGIKTTLLVLTVTLVSYYAARLYVAQRKNLAEMKSKLGSLRVVSGPVYLGNAIWQALDIVVTPVFNLLPRTWTADWIDITSASWPYQGGFRVYEESKTDIFAVASAGGKYIAIANAEAISKICERRKDFQKPVEVYGMVNIFGHNVVTLEGDAWRRHRKVVAPAFTEKNNDLVWKESLYQMKTLLKVWAGRTGNSRDNMLVEDFHPDAADLSLHIISRAGFGIRLKWPGQAADEAKEDASTTLSSLTPPKSHDMTFKSALKNTLDNLLWFAIFPPRTMEKIPLKPIQKAFKSWLNLDKYWQELLDQKLSEVRGGSSKDQGMDLMLRLVEDSGLTKDKGSIPNEQTISAREIMGNAFILMLAGHETTANSIQHSFSFLAMNIGAQKRLQQDIDDIAGSTPVNQWDYKADCDRLFNGMVGAIIYEQLRLMPALMVVAKCVRDEEGDQHMTVDGRDIVIPGGTFMHLNAYAVQRNPRYWPHKPSLRSKRTDDLEDFVPERWLVGNTRETDLLSTREGYSMPSPHNRSLFEPVRGSFIPFSDGQRGCIGRRFALVELTAVVASTFREYSVELAVDEWATDEQVEKMNVAERRVLYQKAIDTAHEKFAKGCMALVTLRLTAKNTIPVRIVKRGTERFFDCFV